jgi:hypothetical protein
MPMTAATRFTIQFSLIWFPLVSRNSATINPPMSHQRDYMVFFLCSIKITLLVFKLRVTRILVGLARPLYCKPMATSKIPF